MSHATFRDVQRLVLERLPGATAVTGGIGTLEALSAPPEPPRIIESRVIEGTEVYPRRVTEDVRAGFAAFLDGTQNSRVVAYHKGVPIVYGSVAAVVRVRMNRRLRTWGRGPLIARRLYLPKGYLPESIWKWLAAGGGIDVRDTSEADERGACPGLHPLALLERAVHMVQLDREDVEHALAEQWCASEYAPLFIDGSVSKREKVASSPCTVGVIKSHRTMYLDGSALTTVLALKRGERSNVFLVTSSRRTPVASWYLRLRDGAGRDPMWGLVRIECARTEDVGRRADEVSRWVLAEVSPIALPDPRWDKMVYGIHDCEEFLRACASL